MLNRLAALQCQLAVLKALPGKLDIKRHSPSILCLSRLCSGSSVERPLWLNMNDFGLVKIFFSSP